MCFLIFLFLLNVFDFAFIVVFFLVIGFVVFTEVFSVLFSVMAGFFATLLYVKLINVGLSDFK